MYSLLFLAIYALIFSITFIGYYRLTRRVIKTLKKETTKKDKIVIILISTILSFLTANIFNTTGLFLLHFLLITYIFEFLFDIVRKIFKLEVKKYNIIRSLCLIPLLLTSIYFIYGYFNMNNIVETKYEIKTNKELSKNYKILLIADVHYNSSKKKQTLKKIIPKLKKEKPDIIILGGDIVDENTTKKQMQEVFKLFGSITPKIDTYYIYGNHDKQNYAKEKAYTLNELEEEIQKNNIKILDDEKDIIDEDLIIYGRGENIKKRMSINDLVQAEDKEKFSIMLDHQPLEYKENKEKNIDLILSGHTHSGQIIPAKLFIDIFKTADLSYGYKKDGNLNAITSSGLFGWGFPIRTEKHSEYVTISITKKNS